VHTTREHETIITVEEKLDMLLAMLQEKKFPATPPIGKTMYNSMFHTPIARRPKLRGRNETLVSNKFSLIGMPV
jgi:hypothetical protein